MRHSIVLAMTAALALSACDMVGAGRPEKAERNESAEENSSSSGNSSRSEAEGSERSTRNDEERGSRSEEDRGSRDESRSTDQAEDGADSSEGDSRLERDLQTAVRRQQSRLPMRDGPGTITAMEAEGSRLIVTMNVEQDFGEAEWDQMAAALQRNICGDRASRLMIERGAAVIYRITDSDGQQVNMRTDRCN